MANRPFRPGALEFRSRSFDPPANASNASLSSSANASMTSLSLADLPSPRAGEVPPALSPLDALAFQGRLLAKRFEQQDTKTGRRVSRLPPLTIQNEFGNRMGYFSSLSSSTNSPNDEPSSYFPRPASSPRQETSDKHKSLYPQLAGNDDHQNHPLPAPSPLPSSQEPSGQPQSKGYFDMPRSHSPESVEPRIGLQQATPVSPTLLPPASQRFLSPQRKNTADYQPRPQPQSNLLGPKSPTSLYSQRSPGLSPSIRSVPADRHDEPEDMSLNGPFDYAQQNRSLSPTSGSFRAHSPFSPVSIMPLTTRYSSMAQPSPPVLQFLQTHEQTEPAIPHLTSHPDSSQTTVSI